METCVVFCWPSCCVPHLLWPVTGGTLRLQMTYRSTSPLITTRKSPHHCSSFCTAGLRFHLFGMTSSSPLPTMRTPMATYSQSQSAARTFSGTTSGTPPTHAATCSMPTRRMSVTCSRWSSPFKHTTTWIHSGFISSDSPTVVSCATVWPVSLPTSLPPSSAYPGHCGMTRPTANLPSPSMSSTFMARSTRSSSGWGAISRRT